METIDLAQWPRRDQFEFFSAVSHPFYSVTFTLDVTGLYRYVKSRGLSFYYGLVYLSTVALNQVEAFRYTLKDGQVVLLEERVPSFTDLRPGSDRFHIVTLPCRGGIDRFCAEARAASAAQTQFICPEGQGIHLAYFSCLPWVELTAVTNERDFDRDDGIPRLTWGKYRDEDGRKRLGFSMELNHRFIDGIHIGQFAAALEKLIDEL